MWTDGDFDLLKPVFSLWIDGALRRQERACLGSFVAAGHRVTLHTYGDVPNVPDGVDLRSANEIMPLREAEDLGPSASPALIADKFRYRALQDGAGIWVDTDVYCLRPIGIDGDFVAGWESDKFINNAVLYIRRDHPILAEMLHFAGTVNRIPWWVPLRQAIPLHLRRLRGQDVWPADMPRATFGPKGLTALARKHAVLAQAQPREVFYPLHPRRALDVFAPGIKLADVTTDASLTLHLWNEKIAAMKGAVPSGSVMAELLGEQFAADADRMPGVVGR